MTPVTLSIMTTWFSWAAEPPSAPVTSPFGPLDVEMFALTALCVAVGVLLYSTTRRSTAAPPPSSPGKLPAWGTPLHRRTPSYDGIFMRPSGRWELGQDDGSRLLQPCKAFGKWGRGEGNFLNPRFLLPVDGGVLVADSGNDRLQIFSADGAHVRSIYGTQPGHPTGLATDGTHAWVADSSNCTVAKIVLRDGTLVARTGSYGQGPGKFSGPEGLALSRGVLFVADEGNCRVVLLDASTLAWRGHFGTRGTGPGQLSNPVGLTAIDNGNRLELYVRDTQNHRIQVFDVTGANGPGVCGAFLRAFGDMGDGPGDFNQPTGMTTDGRGRILVSEAGAARIQVLTMRGEPLQVTTCRCPEPHAPRPTPPCPRAPVPPCPCPCPCPCAGDAGAPGGQALRHVRLRRARLRRRLRPPPGPRARAQGRPAAALAHPHAHGLPRGLADGHALEGEAARGLPAKLGAQPAAAPP